MPKEVRELDFVDPCFLKTTNTKQCPHKTLIELNGALGEWGVPAKEGTQRSPRDSCVFPRRSKPTLMPMAISQSFSQAMACPAEEMLEAETVLIAEDKYCNHNECMYTRWICRSRTGSCIGCGLLKLIYEGSTIIEEEARGLSDTWACERNTTSPQVS